MIQCNLTCAHPLAAFCVTNDPRPAFCKHCHACFAPSLLPLPLNFLSSFRALKYSTFPGSNNENVALAEPGVSNSDEPTRVETTDFNRNSYWSPQKY